MITFKKNELSKLPFCYAVSHITIDGQIHYLYATDGPGACLCINANTLEQETVWDSPGGTMSIVPIPNKNGEFLASQRFLPGFAARHAQIVHARRENGKWIVEIWMDLPYVHRFDILERGGQYYFLGCILSSTDAEKADWSCPGYLVAAPLSSSMSPPVNPEIIAKGMTRNHGYCKVEEPNGDYVFTACDEGVFKALPPNTHESSWNVVQILDKPTSDIAICDIDCEGDKEIATIEPFHGTDFVIYKQENSQYREIYRYPFKMDFVHALWGGYLCGRPGFLCGCRKLNKDLFWIQKSDSKLKTQIIEKGFGPSNVTVISGDTHNCILVANRESGQADMFYATAN